MSIHRFCLRPEVDFLFMLAKVSVVFVQRSSFLLCFKETQNKESYTQPNYIAMHEPRMKYVPRKSLPR